MFVRGFSNIASIESIQETVDMTPLRTVSLEFRTKDDTLSMWHIEDQAGFLDAALNIAIPRGKIDTAVFMLIDDDLLSKYHVNCKCEPEKSICVKESKAIHYNIINVQVKDVCNILTMYRSVYLKEKIALREQFIIQWTSDETKSYILKAIQNNRITNEHANVIKKRL